MKPFRQSLAISIISASVALLALQTLHADVIYSEAVSGDLPGDQSFPELLKELIPGTNTILGNDSLNTDIGSQGDTFERVIAQDGIRAWDKLLQQFRESLVPWKVA